MSFDFSALLAPGGHMREFMRTAPGGGEWVDDVCDALLLDLDQTHLEDFTLTHGAQNANVALLQDGGVQLNIAWLQPGSWACHTAPSFAEAVAHVWAQRRMIERLKEEDQNNG